MLGRKKRKRTPEISKALGKILFDKIEAGDYKGKTLDDLLDDLRFYETLLQNNIDLENDHPQ